MPDVLKKNKSCNTNTQRLCRRVSQQQEPLTVFKKHFPLQEITVSLRTLSINTDIEPIYEWINHEYSKQVLPLNERPLRQLRQTYELMLYSDFAQSFVGLIDENPVCQLDICHALKDEISLLYDAKPGDYNINVLMAPQFNASSLTVCILQAFMEYFFSCPEVKRIIGEPDADDLRANNLLQKLGFQFQERISMSYKTANLYVCTQDNLSQALSHNISAFNA